MKNLRALLLALLLAPSLASTHEGPEPNASAMLVEPAAMPAESVVREFGRALQAGDLARVEALLAPEALVLESGGAERTRAQYLAEHAGADAAFLKKADIQILRRVARAAGELAWVATESEIRAGGKTHLSTETMVLQKRDGAWRIVHIHWSSRAKAAAGG